MRHRQNGSLVVTTTFWYCIAQNNGNDSPCGVYIDVYSDRIKIGPYGAMNATGAFISVSRFEANGSLSHLHASNSSAYNESYGEYQIIGYKYSGNVAMVNSYLTYNDFFTVYYSDDESAVLLEEIYRLIQSQDITADIEEIRANVLKIYNTTDSMNTKLAQLRTYLKSVDDKLTNVQTSLNQIYSRQKRKIKRALRTAI